MATILYVGTHAGVDVVRRDAQGWRIDGGGLRDWSVPDIAVDPSAPNRAFAGTRGDGVWLTEDFGQTWRKPSYGRRGPGKVQCVTLDPTDSDMLYVGTEPIDLWVSRDGGQSWTSTESVWEVPSVPAVTYPVPTVEPHVRDITVDPQDTNTIYAALQVGHMLKSTDGGTSWTLLDKGVDADVHTIVLRPDDPNRMYVATGGHDNRLEHSSGRALYRSEDAGATWAPMAMEFPQEYSVPLAMHAANPDVLYSAVAKGPPPAWRRPSGAEASMIRSKDGGATWQSVATSVAELTNDFAVAIAIDGEAPQNVYVVTRSGVLFASGDAGESWDEIGVRVTEIGDVGSLQVAHTVD